jgi:adenylate cyclase
MLEIERKWIVDPDEFAEMMQHGVVTELCSIRQGYIVNTKDLCVRARREYRHGEEGRTILTVKMRVSDLVRQEFEYEIADCVALHDLPTIWKTRYTFEDYEIDVFGEDLEGLVLAEREYPNVDEADDDDVPFFCTEEVTHDPRYNNAKLLPPVFYNQFEGRLYITQNGVSTPL